MVQAFHELLGDQAMSVWCREIEHSELRGVTPFYSLLSALAKNPESKELWDI